MKKLIGKLLKRIRHQSQSSSASALRSQLRMEALEGRQLLSADGLSAAELFPHHNSFIPEDVDFNFSVTARDALIGINKLNRQEGLEPLAEDQKFAELRYDVNGDNEFSAADVLRVINALNGEGETTPSAVYTYNVVDDTGAPITDNQVQVGDRFNVQVFVRDNRNFTMAEGINAAFVDIGYDTGTPFDIVVSEIQSFQYFTDQLDGSAASSTFTLSFDGQTTNPINILRTDDLVAVDIQTELESLPNIGAGNVSVLVDQIQRAQDREDNVPRFSYEIRFLNDLAIQDLPEITVNGSNVAVNAGQTWDNSLVQVVAGDRQDLAAQATAIFFSETYNFSRLAEVTDTAFNDVGGASPTIPLPSPTEDKLVFTIPMLAVSAGTINFTPAFPDNSPTTDTVAGTTTLPASDDPMTSMVDFGDAFSVTVVTDQSAPVAINDTINVDENGSFTLNGNVTSNDTVTAPRTLSVLSAATLAGTQGSLNGLVYTAPTGFVGTDTITYVAQDSTGLTSNTGTVTINIQNVNDPPVAANDAFTVDEDSTANPFDVLANDDAGTNDTSDTLTIIGVGNTSNGGIVNFTASSITYSPAVGFVGTETFTYTVEDSGSLTDTATVTVTVEPTSLPRARGDSVTVQEGFASVDIDVLANDSANPGAQTTLLSFSNLSVGGSISRLDGGTPSDLTDDSLQVTIDDSEFNGEATFTYTINDTAGTGVDSTATVTINVTDVNDPPILANDTANATEDTEATFLASTLLSNDSPGTGEDSTQTLSITAVSAVGGGGSVALNGSGDVVYTPAADFNGQFLFTYEATDDGSPTMSDTATVTVTVAAVNDAPIAGTDTVSGTEDQTTTIATSTLLANDSAGPADESGQTLAITGVSATGSGSVSLSGGNVTYTPPADFNGADTFTYTLSDGITSSTGTVTINVAPVNDAPIAVADSVTGFSQQGITIPVADLLSNDSPGPANESAQTLSVVAVAATANTNGTVSLSNGVISYNPVDGFEGDASFEYTLQDSEGGQATGTVNVNVQSFSPSTLGGNVWIDETNDGIIDSAERHLGSIIVTLSGTALGESITPQSKMTLSDGSYSFENLAPGTYTITMTQPHFFRDGHDVPGALGDLDSIENQFTVNIAEPGGVADMNYNFGMLGLDGGYARPLDQLASSYIIGNPTLAFNGALFGLGADNSLLWSAKLDGFSDAMFAEAVMDTDGSLLLTFVDDTGAISTSSLGRGEFVRVTDAGGNSLIRVLGGESAFDFQRVSMSAPPFTAARYLDSVDAVFNQEGW